MSDSRTYRVAITAILLAGGFTTETRSDQTQTSAKAAAAFLRSADDTVGPGMRIMVVDPTDVTPSTDNAPARVQIATIAKVTGVKGGRLTILDDFGLGEVDQDDIILLRRRDVFEQIEKRIPASHQTLAKAEFAALYSTPKAWKLFIQAIDEQPDNQWFRARQAKFFYDRNRLMELQSVNLELKDEGRAAAIGQVTKSLPLSNYGKIDQLQAVLYSDPTNTFARIALMNNYADMAGIAQDISIDDEQFGSMQKVAFEILEQVPNHPSAFVTQISTTIRHYQRGGNVSANVLKLVLDYGAAAVESDPYNHALLIAMADGCREVGDLVNAGKYALSAVQKFPRKSESMACLLRCAVARSTNREVDDLFEAFQVADIAEALKLIEGIDIVSADPLPPLRLVDGNCRMDIGYSVDEETQLSAYAILCLRDAHGCIRYLNQYDPSFDITESNPKFEELIAACCYSGSYHALQYILFNVKPKFDSDRAFDQAISRRSKVCLWVLWKNGLRPSDVLAEKLADALSTKPVELESAIAKSALDGLAELLPKALHQAIEMRHLGVNHERSSRNLVSDLESIAQQQAIFGDRGGYSQTMDSIRETRQGITEGQQMQELASLLLVDNLEREYVAIEPMLDDDAKQTWIENVDKFVESKEQWMKEGRSKWTPKSKSESK